MDKQLEMSLQSSYAMILTEEQADEIDAELFPQLDGTADLDLEHQAEDALHFLRNRASFEGDLGLRLRNFDAADDELLTNITQALKGFCESRSFNNDDLDTFILITGTDSLSQYEPDLMGRVYNGKSQNT